MTTSSKEEFYRALNSQFTPQKEFGDTTILPEAPIVANDEIPGYNTKIVLNGIPGKAYYGNVELYYGRSAMSRIGSGIKLYKEGQFTHAEIAAQLAGRYGANITVDDINPRPIPSLAPGESKSYSVFAKTTSLGWVGVLPVTLVYAKAAMTDVVYNRKLNAYQHPNGKTDYPSAWMMAYYMDFTSHRDALLINPITRRYTDEQKVLEILDKLGFPSMAVSGATDYPTSAIPDSNQAFNRVIIQSTLWSPEMYGPMYFHYNLFDEGSS